MRICFAHNRPVYPLFRGGAEISMHEILRTLSKAGHECLAIGSVGNYIEDLAHWLNNHAAEIGMEPLKISGPHDEKTLFRRLEIKVMLEYEIRMTFLADFQSYMPTLFRTFEPDIVFSQLEGSEKVIEQQKWLHARFFHFIRDVVNPNNFLPFGSVWVPKGSFTCMSNSIFVKHELQKQLDIDSTVMYPGIDLDRFHYERSIKKDSIVMFNPVPLKGENIIRHLITAYPGHHFMLVEGGRDIDETQWPYKNVTIVRRTHNIESVYHTACLLVAPSQNPEAFCRVVVEAQACGVPVLASKHSGLKEAYSGQLGLIEDYQNPRAWTQAVKQVLDNPEIQQTMREEGFKKTKKFSSEQQCQVLLELLRT